MLARGDDRLGVADPARDRRHGQQPSRAPAGVDLTRREFELLAVLAAAEGLVLRREEIYERAPPEWRYIHTHHRVGYRLEAEPVAEAFEAVVWI
jgi:DNA-binding response OmpR family regulator